MKDHHRFYTFCDRIEPYYGAKNSILISECYVLWIQWLQELILDSTVNDAFSYSGDMLYYGSCTHVDSHRDTFNQWLAYTQSRVEHWSPLMIALADKYRGVSMNVGHSYTNSFGEMDTTIMSGKAYDVLSRYAWRGKYVVDLGYREDLHRAISDSIGASSIVYAESSWTTFIREQSPNAWSDLGFIFHHVHEDYPVVAYPDTVAISEDHERYVAYTKWIKRREKELDGLAWEDLPIIFRTQQTWRDVLRFCMSAEEHVVDISQFDHLPSACRTALSSLVDAFHVFTENFDLRDEDLYPMLLNLLPNMPESMHTRHLGDRGLTLDFPYTDT